ncbi:hypothetical protein FIBSPDRAFT_936330 [Athelia psychrophila]|uniref:Uncharacterized protein n=1 Tax=Athelia psychrophila TaxID=1759441 RepID=A0A166CAR3_9AGAM|nr:hypothetical protein FIBSPDRAFT_936330 [Fibularhizoctonia sp. CBS 109695]
MFFRLSLIVFWCHLYMGGVHRELEVEPLPAEDFSRDLGGEDATEEPQLAPTNWKPVEDFAREWGDRGCGGDACISEGPLNRYPWRISLGNWGGMIVGGTARLAPEGGYDFIDAFRDPDTYLTSMLHSEGGKSQPLPASVDPELCVPSHSLKCTRTR